MCEAQTEADSAGTLLTSADVARIIGRTPARVQQLAIAGQLPFTKTAGGIRLYRRDDVTRYVARREGRAD
jgi:Helix-turn-helix domain